jgi:hypothetical protein
MMHEALLGADVLAIRDSARAGKSRSYTIGLSAVGILTSLLILALIFTII